MSPVPFLPSRHYSLNAVAAHIELEAVEFCWNMLAHLDNNPHPLFQILLIRNHDKRLEMENSERQTQVD